MRKTTLLVVLDGFGHSDTVEHNAIAQANSPTWDRFWSERPRTLIDGSGTAVGLPDDQMGNSEVGHMHLGAGRVVYQDFTRINRAIEQDEFASNSAFQQAFTTVAANDSALHVFGLLSPGGVHSHEAHILALLQAARDAGVERLFLHAFLDGRDTPPRSARASLDAAEQAFEKLYGKDRSHARLASICGRYWAMDRDKRWDRVQRAYDMLTLGDAPFEHPTAVAALDAAYARDESDEFVQPTVIVPDDTAPAVVRSDDAVVFMNFRADRAREISHAFLDADFDGFERRQPVTPALYVSLTRYSDDLPTVQAFPPQELKSTFGEVIASRGLRQLRIAETEKYAHVTFFFSGGDEKPFTGEDRELVPSPKVATYDLQPEMSAEEVTDKLVEAIHSGRYDAIVCNYANGDMVGHTGVMPAAIKAVETLDACLARIEAALADTGGQMLITADHGNVECMQDNETGQAHTAHTSRPVPLVYVGPRALELRDGGTLADVAPTLLALMDLAQPPEMTGTSLAVVQERRRA